MIRTEGSFRCLTHGHYSTLAQVTKGKSRRAREAKPALPPIPRSEKTVRHQVSQHCTAPVQPGEARARQAFNDAEARYKLVKVAVDTWRADVRDWGKDIKESRGRLKDHPAALEERLAFLARRLDNAKAQLAIARTALRDADKARKSAFRGLCDALGIMQPKTKPTAST